MLIINKLKFLALQLLIRKVKQANTHDSFNTSKSLTRKEEKNIFLPANFGG